MQYCNKSVELERKPKKTRSENQFQFGPCDILDLLNYLITCQEERG